MAARTAVRRNLGWRSSDERLLARGKRPQVALIAIALLSLNAMVRGYQP